MPQQNAERIAIEWIVATKLSDALKATHDALLSEQVLALLEDHSNDDTHAPEVVATTRCEPELIAYVRAHGVPHRIVA